LIKSRAFKRFKGDPSLNPSLTLPDPSEEKPSTLLGGFFINVCKMYAITLLTRINVCKMYTLMQLRRINVYNNPQRKGN
tara:strand:- start:1072 stop:1308 length:237 start_codon:yes stop_codon:yes gene_type:complete